MRVILENGVFIMIEREEPEYPLGPWAVVDMEQKFKCENCGLWAPIPIPPAVVDPDKPLLCPACEGSVI